MADKCKLTRVGDGGIYEDGRKQEIVIDDVTQLGRLPQCVAESPGCKPEMLAEAKIAISVDDPTSSTSSISRNHAIIYPPSDTIGNFQVGDLKSGNGTFINGVRINNGDRMLLSPGDIIGLGSSVRFLFEPFEAGPNSDHALMVGHDGFNLHGPKKDVEELKAELEKRHFAGNIETLINGDATREKILRALNHFKGKVTKDSLFAFYFSGHGTEQGELILGAGKLKAEELISSLKEFRGKILLILDGCFTDSIASFAETLPHFAMIGHSTKAYEGHRHTIWLPAGASLSEDIRGHTTRAIVKALEQQTDRINIKQLVAAIEDDRYVRASMQKVQRRGNTEICLRTQMTPAPCAEIIPNGYIMQDDFRPDAEIAANEAVIKEFTDNINSGRITEALGLKEQHNEIAFEGNPMCRQAIENAFMAQLKWGNLDIALLLYRSFCGKIKFAFVGDFIKTIHQRFSTSLTNNNFDDAYKIYNGFGKTTDLSYSAQAAYLNLIDKDNISAAKTAADNFLPGRDLKAFIRDGEWWMKIKNAYLRSRKDGRTYDALYLRDTFSGIDNIDFDAIDQEIARECETVREQEIANELRIAQDRYLLCLRGANMAEVSRLHNQYGSGVFSRSDGYDGAANEGFFKSLMDINTEPAQTRAVFSLLKIRVNFLYLVWEAYMVYVKKDNIKRAKEIREAFSREYDTRDISVSVESIKIVEEAYLRAKSEGRDEDADELRGQFCTFINFNELDSFLPVKQGINQPVQSTETTVGGAVTETPVVPPAIQGTDAEPILLEVRKPNIINSEFVGEGHGAISDCMPNSGPNVSEEPLVVVDGDYNNGVSSAPSNPFNLPVIDDDSLDPEDVSQNVSAAPSAMHVNDGIFNDENFNPDAFFRLLDLGDFQAVSNYIKQFGDGVNIDLRQSERYQKAIRKCFSDCLSDNDFANAYFISSVLGYEMDFTKEIQDCLMELLDENDKNGCYGLFEYFDDEALKIFDYFLRNGWVNYADKFYKEYKDWREDNNLIFYDLHLVKPAEQGMLRCLEDGRADDAVALLEKYVFEDKYLEGKCLRDVLWLDGYDEAVLKGFYGLLTMVSVKEAVSFREQFDVFREIGYTDVLKKAYRECLDKGLIDLSIEIRNTFGDEVDFLNG